MMALFAVYHPDQIIDGRRLFFVEPNPAVRGAQLGWRSAPMLVAPHDVPPDVVRALPPPAGH